MKSTTAQIVGYFEDNVTFTEGPFVAVCINGWRIEVELKGNNCPVLPDMSIYKMLKDARGKEPGKTDWLECEANVNWLNEQVKRGRIVLNGKTWVAPSYPWK